MWGWGIVAKLEGETLANERSVLVPFIALIHGLVFHDGHSWPTCFSKAPATRMGWKPAADGDNRIWNPAGVRLSSDALALMRSMSEIAMLRQLTLASE